MPEKPKEPVKVEHYPITLHVISAKGARNADFGSKSDCFVEVVGLKAKTKVVNNSLEPVWDEILPLPEYVKGTELVLELLDSDLLTKSDKLGKLVISAADVEKGVDAELKLIETGSATTFMKIKITKGLPPPPPAPVKKEEPKKEEPKKEEPKTVAPPKAEEPIVIPSSWFCC